MFYQSTFLAASCTVPSASRITRYVLLYIEMPSFVITFYGQCCRRHVVGQRVVNDIGVVRSCWSICSLCSESKNTNLLLRLLVAFLGTYILPHIPNVTWPTTWRRILDDHRQKIWWHRCTLSIRSYYDSCCNYE